MLDFGCCVWGLCCVGLCSGCWACLVLSVGSVSVLNDVVPRYTGTHRFMKLSQYSTEASLNDKAIVPSFHLYCIPLRS